MSEVDRDTLAAGLVAAVVSGVPFSETDARRSGTPEPS
jgi:hypothetical protein